MQYSDKLVLVSINSKYIQSNTAVYYLYEIIKSAEIDAVVLNHNINEDFHDILSSILNARPVIVCFSCYIWNISLVYDLCSGLHDVDKNIKIILGGPEVSFEPREALEKSNANLIVRGEGETVILEAIRGLITGAFQDIPGLYYIKNNRLTDTGYAVTEDLSEVPFPFTEYMMDREKGKLIYYESSRGCPFNCIYCLSSATRGVRYFAFNRVKEELNKILEYNPAVLKFTDRSFNSDLKRAAELLEFLGSLNTRTCFHLEIYPGELTEEMISRLGGMPVGRVQIEAGIQSTDAGVLSASGRPQDPEKALLNLKRLMEKENMHVHIDLIAGLPGDKLTSFEKSFNDTISVHPHKLQMGFLKLLKGTEARRVKGYKYTGKPPYEVLSSDSMDYYEIQRLREISKTMDLFYNSGHFRNYFGYSIKRTNSPFRLLESITGFMEENEISAAGISREGKYRILADFSKGDTNALNLLGYDYLISFRTKSLPSFLGGRIVSKETTFEFLKQNMEGEARNLYKTHVIAEFIIDGIKSTYLIDYSEQSPVTGEFLTNKLNI